MVSSPTCGVTTHSKAPIGAMVGLYPMSSTSVESMGQRGSAISDAPLPTSSG